MAKITKTDLKQFNKAELANFFKSVAVEVDNKKIKIEDAADDILKAIEGGKVPKNEIEEFLKNLVEVDKNAEYVVVSMIKENGKKFMPGQKYTGDRVGRYLTHGQIRKKEE